MSQLFASGGQSTGASASAPALPVNIEGWLSRRPENRPAVVEGGGSEGWTESLGFTDASCCLQDG